MGKHRKKSKTAKKKSGRHTWTTESQTEFLVSNIPAYSAAQAARTTTDFWPMLMTEYLKKWPTVHTNRDVEDGLTIEEKVAKEKKRIKQWFNNHTREANSGKSNKKALLNLAIKKPRLLPGWQAYSHLYYDDKVKPTVTSRWEELKKQLADGSIEELPAKIKFSNDVTIELFANESNEVKEEVETYRQNYNVEDEDPNADADEAARAAKARAYNEAQGLAPQTLTRILNQLLVQCGYVGAVILAAPEPARDGAIKMLTLFSGKTPLGYDWGELYGSDHWYENVEGPLGVFASKVYSPEDQRAFALPQPKSNQDSTLNTAVNSRATTAEPAQALAKRLRESFTCEATPSTTIRNNPKATKSRLTPVPGPSTKQLDRDHDESDGSNTSDSEESSASDHDSDDEIAPKRNTTPTAKFTTKLHPKPSTKQDDFVNWDNGEPLTAEEHTQILALKSNYERSRAMNIRRNKRIANEYALLEDDVNSAGENVKKVGNGKGKGKAKQEAKSKEPERRSKRNGPSQVSESQNIPPARSSPVVSYSPSRQPSPKSAPPSLADTHPTHANWPDWMPMAVHQLEKLCSDQSWITVVETWIQFEGLLAYPQGQGKKALINNSHRPEAIGTWLKTGRKYDTMPDVSDYVHEFGSSWWKWWTSLQPEWRGSDPLGCEVPDWSELQKGGPNGFFTLLFSLGWWGAGLSGVAEDLHSDWDRAFEDLVWVLDQMNKCLSSSRKRDQREAGPSTESGSKRRRGNK